MDFCSEDKKSVYLTKMDKSVFQIIDSGSNNPKDETSYWLSKPVIDRFIALELIRQRCYNYDSSTARLQRVFSITQKA